jgi:hypothetical protein
MGLRVARSGGHALAQAPVQALELPESFWNRYSVWPRELTRIFPRPPFEIPIVAGLPSLVIGGAAESFEPPQPTSASMETAAVPARIAMSLLAVMSVSFVCGHGGAGATAVCTVTDHLRTRPTGIPTFRLT